MRYASVCSGIEAATVAWHPLGWEPAFFSETAEFPRAVLEHHYPEVPLLGDFTEIEGLDKYGTIELLVAGTPCQSFSQAGNRKGMDDARGNLALKYIELVAKVRPTWVVWENVPGVLSANGGRDFGTILGALAELGYSFAWRICNAEFFGVPQRRRRVFLVGHIGDWRAGAAVLFDASSLRGSSAASKKNGKDIAGTLASRAGGGSWPSTIEALGGFIRPVGDTVSLIPTIAPTLRANDKPLSYRPDGALITEEANVRKLTPIECERLQGFEDNWTRIPWNDKPAEQCPDGRRYSAIGNSMAVPVMRWIGERIKMVDEVLTESQSC